MAGKYTDIVEFTAPSEAYAGYTVNVEVKVKNISSSGYYIAVTGNYIYIGNGYKAVEMGYSPDYAWIPAGGSQYFTSLFTMQNSNVSVNAFAQYWDGSQWIKDDSASVLVYLKGIVITTFKLVNPVAGATLWALGYEKPDGTWSETSLKGISESQFLDSRFVPSSARISVRLWKSLAELPIYEARTQSKVILDGRTYTYNCSTHMLDGIPTGLVVDVVVDPPDGGYAAKNPDKPVYLPGEKVSFSTVAYEGYEFDKWTWNQIGSSESFTITLTVNESMTVTAHFTKVVGVPGVSELAIKSFSKQ